MHDREQRTAPAVVAPVVVPAVAPVLLGTAAASIGAGLVHAAAAGTHVGADVLVRLFVATAIVQVAIGVLALLRPNRLVLFGGALSNLGFLAAWALSRTRGLPWPTELHAVEEVGTQDSVAALLAGLASSTALLTLVRPRLRVPQPGPVHPIALGAALVALAIAIAVPGMAASHTHGASHDHSHTGDESVAHSHDGEVADGPIISLDDSRVTDEQRAAAQSLIDTTTAAVAGFGDPASVQAAGYVSIGDSSTGYEHYINIGYIADGTDLDPSKIESIVYTVNPDGSRTLASAMYILGFGETMADVPDVAGPLTTWHDHQNLCWEGAQVVGTTDATGSCQRGEFRSTPPMLHVWVVDNPCGPFAGLEGHGTGCAHTHN